MTTPYREERQRIPFDKFRELVREKELPETQPEPRHTGINCARCEWDMAIYGEACWDVSTKQHLSIPLLVRRRPL